MSLNLGAGVAAGSQHIGNSTYSMYGTRNYDDETCDCSGLVYYILRAAGGYNYGFIPSTETLHDYLTRLGFELIAENEDFAMQRFDVIIWGQKGFSAGAGGHTGVALDNQNWIECTAWSGAGPYGGTIIANHDQRWAMAGGPYFYAYRYKGLPAQTNKPKKKGVATMFCIYWVPNAKGDGMDAWYFNGVTYEYIHDYDSIKLYKEIYKKNNGKDMPEEVWKDKKAPWWIRLEQPVVNLQAMSDKLDRVAKKVGV